MNTPTYRSNQVVSKFHDKEYRDSYVNSHIKNGLSFQIRGIRKDRGLSQKDFGEEFNTQQAGVSRLENPNYGKFSLETLRKIASIFDVALMVRFVPFSELIAKTATMTREDIIVPSFNNDEKLYDWNNISDTQYIEMPLNNDSAKPEIRSINITSTNATTSPVT